MLPAIEEEYKTEESEYFRHKSIVFTIANIGNKNDTCKFFHSEVL